jgi:hypothetical protein
MTSIADSAVLIQTSSVSVPSPPSWFGEVVLIAAHLRQHGVLSKISERVRFARRRFGALRGDRLSRRADRAMLSAANARSSLMVSTARSKQAPPNSEPGDDQVVRRPSGLCHLARVGNSVTRS